MWFSLSGPHRNHALICHWDSAGDGEEERTGHKKRGWRRKRTWRNTDVKSFRLNAGLTIKLYGPGILLQITPVWFYSQIYELQKFKWSKNQYFSEALCVNNIQEYKLYKKFKNAFFKFENSAIICFSITISVDSYGTSSTQDQNLLLYLVKWLRSSTRQMLFQFLESKKY